MSGWSADELRRIDSAVELQVASYRPDHTLRPFVTIWGVRHGDDVYVRSAYGPDNGWFRRARASGIGCIRAGALQKDVRFEVPDDNVHPALDAAYHAKYDRYGQWSGPSWSALVGATCDSSRRTNRGGSR